LRLHSVKNKFMIKHYSFDLWLTLIKSNSVFKEERAKYFQKKFNPFSRTLAEVKDIIRNVDLSCNYTNEIVGKNIDALEMYCMVLYNLGVDLSDISTTKINEIYAEIEQIFFNYTPQMYDEDTVSTLWCLQEHGKTLSILSNTGFIKGHTLKTFIQKSDLSQIDFRFMLFSDEHRMSKPNPFFFSKINKLTNGRLDKHEILHVGDNPNADGVGAQFAGIGHVIINNINHSPFTIKDVLNEELFIT